MSAAWKKVRSALPRELRTVLSDTLAQYRIIGVIGSMGMAVVVWLWAGLAFVGLDWLADLPGSVRAWLRLVWIAGGAAAGAVILLRRLSPGSPVKWALYVEELAGGMGGELATSVELALWPRPHPFSPFIQQRAGRRIEALPGSVEVPITLLRRTLKALLPALLIAMTCLAIGGGRFVRGVKRLVLPEIPTPPMRSVILTDIEPGDTRVALGAGLEASCRLEGEAGGDVFLVYSPDGSGPEERFATELENLRYRGRTGPLETSGLYYFQIPEQTRSAEFRVRVLRPPEVVEVRFRVTPPEYTGRLPFEMGADVAAPEGSEMEVRVVTSRSAAGGRLILEDGREIALSSRPEGLVGELTADSSIAYTVEFTDINGFVSSPFPNHRISVKKDQPPEVRITSPSSGKVIVGSDVPVRVEALDDYGIESLSLRVAVPDHKPYTISLRPSIGEVDGFVSGELVQPEGAAVILRPVVVDTCPFRIQESVGEEIVLEVVGEYADEPEEARPRPSPEAVNELLDTVETLLAKERRIPRSDPAYSQLESAFRDAAASLRDLADGFPDGELSSALSELAGSIVSREARPDAAEIIEKVRRLLEPETRAIEADVEPPGPLPGTGEPSAPPPPVRVEQLPDPAELSPGYRRLLEIYRSLLPRNVGADNMEESASQRMEAGGGGEEER